jgi:threonine aldolase
MSQAAQSFASDNVAPVAPEVLAAIGRANSGTVHSYGEDPVTERLQAVAREVFGTELAIHPVATGTAANALALACLAPPHGAVYCHEQAHVNSDECGAPEFYTAGAKLIGLPSPDGKIAAGQLAAPLAHAREMGVHHVQPAAVSISQATEWGTVYAPAEVSALAAAAHDAGLGLHMDGARLGNALAHLGCTPAEGTWRAGVDVLSFGGTKNGALAAEAVVFFAPALAAGFERRRKRAGQLWSKMRYLSAQLLALLEDGLWLRHARHANALAAQLAAGLAREGLQLAQPVQANEVFAHFPAALSTTLRARGFEFYDWPAPPQSTVPLVRLVTRYDQRPEQVEALLAAIRGA